MGLGYIFVSDRLNSCAFLENLHPEVIIFHKIRSQCVIIESLANPGIFILRVCTSWYNVQWLCNPTSDE